jgi:hypothetical protein
MSSSESRGFNRCRDAVAGSATTVVYPVGNTWAVTVAVAVPPYPSLIV